MENDTNLLHATIEYEGSTYYLDLQNWRAGQHDKALLLRDGDSWRDISGEVPPQFMLTLMNEGHVVSREKLDF